MFHNNMTGITVQAKRSKQLGINVNKDGSVREINGKVYVDFLYLGHRARESSGLRWNCENAKTVRHQLDRIALAIADGSFEFAKVFPKSKKAAFFSDLENKLLGRTKQPCDLIFKEYIWGWYEMLKATGRIRERTLHGYKSLLRLYLEPFFGEMPFSDINAATLDQFTGWARRQQYRNKPASNTTINKCFIPLQMICKRAAIEYNWGVTYQPFFGYSKLEQEMSGEQIDPFSLDEQASIVANMPDHWKPYFRFAFCSGLRCGEQISLRVTDLDLPKNRLNVRRAMTLNEDGKTVEDKTKNAHSRRSIILLEVMRSILEDQLKICSSLKSEFLFCTPNGSQVQRDNLRGRVWEPALSKADIPYRPMIQTRHSFATTALALGENPLWIAKVMGHSTTRMVIDVYAKYIANLNGTPDGGKLNQAYK